MFKKLLMIVLVIVFAATVFMGCGQIKNIVNKPEENVISEGESTLGEDINLKDISMEMQGQNTVITMSFIEGSRTAGVPESKLSTVPEYDVALLESPTRLKVDLKIDYFDYADKSEWFLNSIVYGVFHSAQAKSDVVSVYFQLNESVSANVAQDNDRLIITLTPKDTLQKESFFVGLNAYQEYEQSLIPEELGFTPTMCEGLSEIILISPEQRDEQAAKDFAQKTNEAIANIAPTKQAYVFSMKTNELPSFDASADMQSITKEQVMMIDTSPISLPVLVENGRYLCNTPQGSIIYARSYLPDYSQDSEQVLKEQLWEIDQTGRKTELSLPDFYSVEKVESSFDGRYLAILDSGIENKLLYVFDMNESVLHNLGEEGFGNFTTGFAWATDAPVIYAMTGFGRLELMKYDFAAPQTQRVSSVEEKKGAESHISLRNKKIYFSDKTDGENGTIYSVDLETMERVKISDGIDFVISDDGKSIAAIIPKKTDEEAVGYDIVLIGAEPKTIAQEVQTESYFFSKDHAAFYYTTPTYMGVTGAYPFAVLKYDLATDKTTLLGYSKSGRLMPSVVENEFYMIDYFIRNNNNFYVTYIYQDKI
ncbi:MAG: hypothetical protein RR413_00720 [Christensenellaceae bacterium]